MLGKFLTSQTRAEILRILFDGTNGEKYLRQISELTEISLTPVRKEINHLVELDLVVARKDGNRIYFKANTEHPIYPELILIVEKTVGVIAILRERLIDDRIDGAFIFGSMSEGKERSTSDIDLVVIGDIGMRALSKLLSGLQEKIGREINPHIFSASEFQKRISEKDHFLTSILNGTIKEIIGKYNEYY